jgi:hypothetical protein
MHFGRDEDAIMRSFSSSSSGFTSVSPSLWRHVFFAARGKLIRKRSSYGTEEVLGSRGCAAFDETVAMESSGSDLFRLAVGFDDVVFTISCPF